MPFSAKAGFFSDIFGTNASADSVETLAPQNEVNSQNISLLEANVSGASLVDSKVKDQKEGTPIKEDANVTINGNALAPSTSPLGVSDGGVDKEAGFDQVSVYVVRSGDSIAEVAKMFGVTVNTIMWANDLKSKKLTVGDTLIILPVSGIKYTVKKGDTLKGVAKEFKVEVSDIADYNDLALDTKLTIGDELIIPGAEIEVKVETPAKPKPSSSSSKGSSGIPNNYYTADNTKHSGRFIKPIPCRTSQGQHDRYAVDLACGRAGVPIKASMSGRVIFAKKGWNGAFGNLTIIENGGIQTFYAHQQDINVSVGQQVSQGQVIGTVGNTGRSTGPHLHFEVRGARNPGFDNSWAD